MLYLTAYCMKYSQLSYFAGMTTSQILDENNALTNELYRLLRKYSSLRTLMRELKVL